MATIKIGGKDYHLPEITVRQLRLSTPHLKTLQAQAAAADSDFEAAQAMVSEGLKVLAIWLADEHREFADDQGGDDPKAGWEKIEARMTVMEMQGVGSSIMMALAESGLSMGGAPVAAPVQTTEKTSPSATASTESSVSLSPQDAQAETGTQ